MMRALSVGRVSHGYRSLPYWRCLAVPRVPTPFLVARPASTISSSHVSSLESGHIELGQSEGLIFVNNIFPPKLQSLLLLGPLNGTQSYENVLKRINRPHLAASDPQHIIQRVFPKGLDIDVKDVIPRFREGGAFVKYARKAVASDIQIEDAIKDHLNKHPIKPWFNPFQQATVYTVQGRPWIEDLYRIPSQRIRVEFHPGASEGSATELSTEVLYSVFRRYGKIRNIEAQPPDSKVTPKYALVEFTRPSNAVAAKNAVHGFTIPPEEGGGKSGTRVKIKYERKLRFSLLKDWLLNHPRLVIPAVAALVAAITVTVFDPIRTFFIKMKVKATLHAEGSRVVQWIRYQVNKANIFAKRKPDDRGLTAIWEDRQGDIDQLKSWFTDSAESFIVIHGPRGSGKRELVLDRTLKDHKYKLVIDCKQIQDAKGDTAKIARAASQVGYRPIFSFMNSINSWIDLAAQGMIGTKAGFSQTLDAQLSNIWQNTAMALRSITLDQRKKTDSDAQLSDEEYLEAHPELRPVVVIDNYLHGNTENSVVSDKLTEWAAGLTTGNIAHVIFITTDVSFSKPLSKAMPNSVFRTISLGDCSLEVGRKFVLNHLEHEAKSKNKPAQPEEDLTELDSCISVLGGRVTDLEFMAHRIEAGETPQGAVTQIVQQAGSEILKMFILNAETDSQQWTHQQAWHLIKTLAHSKNGSVPYNQLLQSDLFKSNGQNTLRALEQAELITIVSVNGSPERVKPGRPVYQAVFKHLTENKTLSHRLDLDILSQLISKENKSIGTYEEELLLLGKLPKQPREITGRIQWLLQKVYDAQNTISKYEAESSVLKKALKSEH